MPDPTPGNGVYSGAEVLPNTIPAVSEYIKTILDEVYEYEAKTSGMVPDATLVQASQNAGVFKLATMKTTGLGNYDVHKGYPTGAGEVSWEDYELQCDRGIRYLADPKESILGGGLATAVAFFANATREQFIPEIDAYRFSKIYSTINGNNAIKATHITTEASLSGDDILSSVIDGLDVVSDETGIDTGLTIYMNQNLRNTLHKSTEYDKTKDISAVGGFNTNITQINGNNIVWVPKKRMMSAITLNDGFTNAYSDTTTKTVDYNQFGYKKASGAKYLNYVITAPNTCMGMVAINRPKIITKEQSEQYDADQAMIRMWHDLIIPKNKQPGVYISVGGSVS